MSAPNPTQKDGLQVLKYAFEDDTGRIRVDAVISPDGHDLEIHYQDDSIAIGDPASDNILAINSDGSINVQATIAPASSGATVNQYNEVTGIAMGGSATVFTYTVPVGKTLHLARIEFSGDCISEWVLNFNGSPNAKKRLHWMHFNDQFEFLNDQDGYSLAAGTVIDILATNHSPFGVAEFNANLQGVLT